MTDPSLPAPLGLDFGTATTIAAAVTTRGIELQRNAQLGRRTPTVACAARDTDDPERCVGPHGSLLVGQDAYQRVGWWGERPVQSDGGWAISGRGIEVRSRRGDEEIAIGDRIYPISELLCEIVTSALSAQNDNEELSVGTVAVPIRFDAEQRAVVRSAVEAASASTEEVRIVDTPVAAAAAYRYHHNRPSSTVGHDTPSSTVDHDTLGSTLLVYELGATATATLVEIDEYDGPKPTIGPTISPWAFPPEEAISVRSSVTDRFVGGHQFDLAVANRLVEQYLTEWGYDIRLEGQTFPQLLSAVEQTKRTLSAAEEATVTHPLLGVLDGEVVAIDEPLTRERFRRLTADVLARAMEPLEELLDDPSVDREGIDDVLLIGGTTALPSVRQAVERRVGAEPISVTQPDLTVAHGAALLTDR